MISAPRAARAGLELRQRIADLEPSEELEVYANQIMEIERKVEANWGVVIEFVIAGPLLGCWSVVATGEPLVRVNHDLQAVWIEEDA